MSHPRRSRSVSEGNGESTSAGSPCIPTLTFQVQRGTYSSPNPSKVKSYEAIYNNGQVQWIADQPETGSARVIVTILEDTGSTKQRRIPPVVLAGKVKIRGDIVSPIVDEKDWTCLK